MIPLGFHAVVHQPGDVAVLDLTGAGPWPDAPVYSIGRYGERRGIYTAPLFAGAGEPRSVHCGIDLGAPAGSEVFAFSAGLVLHAGYNPAAGDYGHVLVVEHDVPAALSRELGAPLATRDGVETGILWALYGHLGAASLACSPVGRRVRAGDVLGWLGHPHENGGWPPHVHLQLAVEAPRTHDLPGAVAPSDWPAAQQRWPDPRCVIGDLPSPSRGELR